jgi:hypothetical protein
MAKSALSQFLPTELVTAMGLSVVTITGPVPSKVMVYCLYFSAVAGVDVSPQRRNLNDGT